MKRTPATRWFFGCLALFLLAGCLGHPDLKPGRTRFKQSYVTLPAEIVGDHFLVQGKWDKHGPWNFLIDTGASVTLVSPEFAHRYSTGAPVYETPSVRVRSANGTPAWLSSVTLRRLDLGAARFDNVEALISDLSDISQHLGIKIDGILAFPLFRETVFTLDYPNSRLILKPNAFGALPTGARIKFNNDQRTPLIPVRLGATSLVMLIDSGSDGPFELNPAGLALTFLEQPRPGLTVGNLTGDRTQEIGRLSGSLQLGSYEFKNPVVDLTDRLSSIGGDVLKNFAITFDQAHNQAVFSRPARTPIEMGSLQVCGLAFLKGPTYWRVVAVVPGSPAAENGVQPGDLVARINGEAVANWPLSRFDPYVKRSAEIVFTFLDGTTERPVVIPTFVLVH